MHSARRSVQIPPQRTRRRDVQLEIGRSVVQWKLITIYPADEAQLELVLKELISFSPVSKGLTFYPICAMATARCTSGTAASPNGIVCPIPGNGCWRSSTRTACLSPTFAARSFRHRPGRAARVLSNRIWPPATPSRPTTCRTRSRALCSSPTAAASTSAGHPDTVGRSSSRRARPHAGLDVDWPRRRRPASSTSATILDRFAGLDLRPGRARPLPPGGHRFLVEEFVDGNPLQRLLVHRYPLTHPDPSSRTLARLRPLGAAHA